LNILSPHSLIKRERLVKFLKNWVCSAGETASPEFLRLSSRCRRGLKERKKWEGVRFRFRERERERGRKAEKPSTALEDKEY
jgi:hypothetical protein